VDDEPPDELGTRGAAVVVVFEADDRFFFLEPKPNTMSD
jgi:hypothetical protein